MTLSLEKLLLDDIDEEGRRKIAGKLVEKLMDLHKLGIIHNNLKNSNIFTKDDFSSIFFSDMRVIYKIQETKWSAKLLISLKL